MARSWAVGVFFALAACTSPAESGEDSGSTGSAQDTNTTDEPASDDTTGGDEEPPDDTIRITHAFGDLALEPFEDNAERCASWTLHNEQPIYVQSVLLANEGAFHHSNWFVVPENEFGGVDGYWPCADRGFDEIAAAQRGTVLFAQSTQSYTEDQRLSDGAVIKIPAYSRIVGGLHTLNLSPRDETSGLWMTLEPIHPADVTGVVTPLSIQYKDLDIPAQKQSRFTAKCDLSVPYGAVTFSPLALRLHYILPHYHYLGNYFDVTVIGGLYDGMSVYNLEGFNGEANGLTFDPPMDLPGATGLQMSCGYDNWRDVDVQWGNGDGEMCVMLALVESDAVMGATVEFGTTIVDVVDGVQMHEGPCVGIALPESEDQGMPTEEEKQAPLYLPPPSPGDTDLPPVPECIDTPPDAAPHVPATLSSIRDTVFTPACTFSACHGTSAAAGLDLSRPDLHAALMNHTLLTDAGMPLVTPGDPEQSWLYHVLSRCEPQLSSGATVSHMPRNAPMLLDADLVAKVRTWIETGAAND